MTNENSAIDELDGLPPGLESEVESLEDDETVPFERDKRQEEGWIKQYVECPECQVPMARTTVESDGLDIDEATSSTETVYRAICPQCHKVGSVVLMRRVTAKYDDLDDAVAAMMDDER